MNGNRTLTMLALGGLALAPTCAGSRGTSEDHAAPVEAATTDGDLRADAAAEAPDADQDAPAPSPQRPPETTRLDLLEYFQYAELFVQGGSFCDLGTLGGHRCTRGGHRTGWARPSRRDEQTVIAATSHRPALHLTALEPRDSWLVTRIFSRGARAVDLRLGGERVGRAELERGSWTTLSIPIEASRLRRGDNELNLRFRGGRPGRIADLDWVWLALAEAPAEPPRWPTPAPGAMVIPEGTSLAHALPIPPGSRLALSLQGGPTLAQVHVVSHTDRGAVADELASTEVPAGERVELSVDLDGQGDDFSLLEISVAAADVTVDGAEIRQTTSEDAEPEAEPEPPVEARNLIIYLIDTLRPDHLPTYNPETRVQADALTEFASRSIVFDAAQAQENWTKPSVASLLTSLYPSSHNAQSGEAVLSNDVEMLGEVLGDRGFVTASFIANGYVSRRFGFDQGWDEYRNYVRERRRNRADRVVDDAIAWLDRRPEDQPFFLYVHTIDPHVPYCAPRPYREMYDPDPYRGPIAAHRTAQQLGEIKVGRLEASERDMARLEALYDGEISYHDHHFGRFVAALEERGLLENSLIWITSDHGEEFRDHGSVGHGHNLYQELLHVPLVLSIPGDLRPRRVGATVGLVDLIPTSLELLGLEPHEASQGRSLLPLLRGERPDLYDAAFSEFLENGRALRLDDLKLVSERGEVSLFDLATDPGEERDLADDHPLTTRALVAMLSLYNGSAEEPATRARRGPRPTHRRQEPEIDEETLEQLRALGYMQ